jgi:hypothetical protein
LAMFAYIYGEKRHEASSRAADVAWRSVAGDIRRLN